MESGLNISTLEAVLGIVFAIAAWLMKGKFDEIDRKALALTHKLVEVYADVRALKAMNEALQRQVDREGTKGN